MMRQKPIPEIDRFRAQGRRNKADFQTLLSSTVGVRYGTEKINKLVESLTPIVHVDYVETKYKGIQVPMYTPEFQIRMLELLKTQTVGEQRRGRMDVAIARVQKKAALSVVPTPHPADVSPGATLAEEVPHAPK
ncbi:MAG: hypothetical protein WBK28_02215 [Minisyncoccia bacterium]